VLLTLRLNLETTAPARTVTASQTLAAVTQTTTIGGPEALTAVQTLAAVTQSATVAVAENVTASKTLAPVTQNLTIGEVAGLQAAQTLPGVSQTASLAAVDTLSAAQTLGTVSQALTVTLTAPGLTLQAAQTLASITQSATVTDPLVLSGSQALPAVSSLDGHDGGKRRRSPDPCASHASHPDHGAGRRDPHHAGLRNAREWGRLRHLRRVRARSFCRRLVQGAAEKTG
jgi:hypothetical protein